MRVNTTIPEFSWIAGHPLYDYMKSSTHGGSDAWNPNIYLNIWVCSLNFVPGVGHGLGYATYPNDAGNWNDGVVVSTSKFDANVTAQLRGRTLVHEVGHWMGLYHMWSVPTSNQSACYDDLVTDTPLSQGPIWQGGSCGPSTCSAPLPEMCANYMSYYTEDKQVMFTKGQKTRAYAVFDNGGPRAAIIASSALNPPTTPTLTTSVSTICPGETVTLTASLTSAPPGISYQLYALTAGIRTPIGSSTALPSWTVSPAHSTTYTVGITTPTTPGAMYGCTYEAQATVTVVTATASAGGPYHMSNNYLSPLNGTGAPAGGTGRWSLQNGGDFPLQCGGTAHFVDPVLGILPSGIVPGIYPVCYTYTLPNNCDTDQACAMLQILPPVITVSPGGPYVFLNTAGQTLNGSGLPPNGTGQWSVRNTGLISNGQFPLGNNTWSGFVNSTTGELPSNIKPGTYEVCYTYTPPLGCVSAKECTTIKILPRDCRIKYVEPTHTWDLDPAVPGSTALVLDGLVINPQLPAGRYHVKCPVVLTRGAFMTTPGTEFLFEPGASLTIGAEASLTAPNTHFTAACDDMWPGIIVDRFSNGFYLGDPDTDLTTPLPKPAPYGTAPTWGGISHAIVGVQWDSPPTAPLRLVNTHFFNNLTGVRAGNYHQGTIPATVHPQAAIINSVFDADQERFKLDPVGNLYADWLPFVHLDLNGWRYGTAGDAVVMPLAGNHLRDALLGLTGGHNSDQFRLTVGGANLFERNRIMGIAVPTLTETLEIGLLDEVPNQFQLPPALPAFQPSQRLRIALSDQYSWLSLAAWPSTAAWGIWVGWLGGSTPTGVPMVLRVANAEFTVSQGTPFGNHSYPRTGLEVERAARRYQLENCSFTDLYTGLRLGLENTGEDCFVAGNTFENCGTGLSVRSTLPATFSTAPLFFPLCNTFRRTSSAPAATASVGMHVAPAQYAGAPAPEFDNANVRFITGDPYTVVMKNYFVGGSGTNFQYLHNQAGGNLPYTAYLDKSANCGGCLVQLQNEIQANSTGFNVVPDQSAMANLLYEPSFNCSNEMPPYKTGFQAQRSLSSGPVSSSDEVLLEGRPNPASEAIEITYRVAHVQTATLVVRELMSGQMRTTLPLTAKAGSVRLSVASLRPGVYAYSLLVDGVLVATRKLVVSR